jgi:hypothetical protein
VAKKGFVFLPVLITIGTGVAIHFIIRSLKKGKEVAEQAGKTARQIKEIVEAAKPIIEAEAAREIEGINNNITPVVKSRNFQITMRMPSSTPGATEFPFTIKNINPVSAALLPFYYRVECRQVGQTGLRYKETEGPYKLGQGKSMDTYTKWGTIVGPGFVRDIAKRYRATTYYEYRVVLSIDDTFQSEHIWMMTPWYRFHGF